MMHRCWVLFLAAVVVVAHSASVSAFDLQGHRGARGLMPENTLPAFARALSIGVSTLELDTGVTSDGVVVVSHDQALDPAMTRGADGQWLSDDPPLIRALTLEELQAFDVGRIDGTSRLASRFPGQAAADGARIPTLDAVLKLIDKSGNEDVRVNIETKIDPRQPESTVDPDTFARAVVDVVRSRGFESRATVQSFDWRTLQIVQEIAPEIDTVYLSAQQDWLDTVGSSGASPWTAGFDIAEHGHSVPALVMAAGGTVWSPFHRDVDPQKVREARALGLQVVPWTVNEPPDMERLIAMGVDGLITDYPDRLRQVMADQGMSLPEATPVEP